MKEFVSPLFKGLSEDEYIDMRSCGCMREKNYKKGECILLTGDATDDVGVVLEGSVNIENIDLWGKRTILSNIVQGQIFGETYAITGELLMVDAVAAEDCRILFLNGAGIVNGHHADRTWHKKVIHNLLKISTRKNLELSTRIFQTSFKKTRPRIESYLTAVSRKSGSREFDIPFNRQQLADYLNLDRSALSKELMHMRNEGLLDFHKNHFWLYELADE